MAALLIGYARCFTDQQDLTAQRDGLLGPRRGGWHTSRVATNDRHSPVRHPRRPGTRLR